MGLTTRQAQALGKGVTDAAGVFADYYIDKEEDAQDAKDRTTYLKELEAKEIRKEGRQTKKETVKEKKTEDQKTAEANANILINAYTDGTQTSEQLADVAIKTKMATEEERQPMIDYLDQVTIGSRYKGGAIDRSKVTPTREQFVGAAGEMGLIDKKEGLYGLGDAAGVETTYTLAQNQSEAMHNLSIKHEEESARARAVWQKELNLDALPTRELFTQRVEEDYDRTKEYLKDYVENANANSSQFKPEDLALANKVGNPLGMSVELGRRTATYSDGTTEQVPNHVFKEDPRYRKALYDEINKQYGKNGNPAELVAKAKESLANAIAEDKAIADALKEKAEGKKDPSYHVAPEDANVHPANTPGGLNPFPIRPEEQLSNEEIDALIKQKRGLSALP